MENHKLASQVIATRPMRPADIFDDQELVLLRTYVNDPDKRKDILAERDLWDDDPKVQEAKTMVSGSLTCYAISREAFNEEELEMLREWFATEEMQKSLEGVVARVKREFPTS
jgi:hypothetical protein